MDLYTKDHVALASFSGESSLSGGNTNKSTVCEAKIGAPESSYVVGDPSTGPSGARGIGWLQSLLKGTMLPPPALVVEGRPPETEMERSHALFANLR